MNFKQHAFVRRLATLVPTMLYLMVSYLSVGGLMPKAVSAAIQVRPAYDRFHILKFDGALRNQRHQKRTDVTGVVSILFAIYAQQYDGAPLWQEVQTLQIGANGSFTTLLGAETTGGIPPELFENEKALWLGNLVLLRGEVEAPRIRILSTPGGLTVAAANALPPETAVRPSSSNSSSSQMSPPKPQQERPNPQRERRPHRR